MSTRNRGGLAALSCVALAFAACRARPADHRPHFPEAHRDVSPIISDSFSTEDARDRAGEAEQVMALAGIKPGMSVADLGAGEGYYTVRLAPVVGAKGRVLAEDIVPETRDLLSERVQRENLDNVSVKLGTPDDPMLPPRSFDRIFLVHMYHEVQSPYAFLWNMRAGLAPAGEVIVVDSDRPTKHHGIPPRQLQCEFAALAMRPLKMQRLPDSDVYLMAFQLAGVRPAPEAIKPCPE